MDITHLSFYSAGIRVDIVEPNSLGREKMKNLFLKYEISPQLYRIYDWAIDTILNPGGDDFVLAEGFSPAFTKKRREIMLKVYLKKSRIMEI